jgi:hypothetical protein
MYITIPRIVLLKMRKRSVRMKPTCEGVYKEIYAGLMSFSFFLKINEITDTPSLAWARVLRILLRCFHSICWILTHSRTASDLRLSRSLIVRIAVCWNMALCSLENSFQRFRRTYCLHPLCLRLLNYTASHPGRYCNVNTIRLILILSFYLRLGLSEVFPAKLLCTFHFSPCGLLQN